jgi:elongation factor 1-gamma
MPMKLYTYPGNFRAFKVLIAAECNDIELEVPDFNVTSDNKTPEFLKKNPLGKVPMLETKEGCIFQSNAIARYLARCRADTELYGASFIESGQVDSWIDFCANELEIPVTMWFYPVFGYMPFNAAACAKAKSDTARVLEVLDSHLANRTYMVGEQLTLADIAIVAALVYPMRMLLDPAFRKPLKNVERWYQHCTSKKEFTAVIGSAPLCATMLKAAGDN